jgi:hypothetical protein
MTRPRTFVLTLVAGPGVDPIRALKQLLKLALRRCGLRCLSVEEIAEPPAPNQQREVSHGRHLREVDAAAE